MRIMPVRRTFVIFALMMTCVLAFAQNTKVNGRVLDIETGKPLPFAAVFFEGSQVGTSTDENGAFSLMTRDHSLIVVSAHLLGYEAQKKEVKAGAYTEIYFLLQPEENRLSAVTVKADNSKARRLLRNIDANRYRNNPELRPGYNCDIYSKVEMGLTNPREQLRGKALKSQWGFIFDYVDTSDVSGVSYLPVMINETVAKRHHTLDPDIDGEDIVATRMSGADPSGNLLSQFTGSMHLKNNFYSQYINVFNVDIPSPINSNGLLFYNYYIIDSLTVDGRNTYHVRYHPKPEISTPAFDGEMFVDTGDWALRSVKARLTRGQNMNWVRDMQLEAAYERISDSTWFYRTDRFYADFSVAVRSDTSKLLSVIGNRTIEFSNPEFTKGQNDAGGSLVSVSGDAGRYDESYWEKARPYSLSKRERDVYVMVEQIQETDLYRSLYDIVAMVVNGYYDVGKIGFGPILNLFSFNPLEGFRMRLGIHTSAQWSKTHRLTGYLAYGCRDREFKGGATWEYLISKEPTRKLTLDAHYDVLQMGRGKSMFNDGNILASVLGAGKTQKLCPITELSALYEHEFNANFNTAWMAMFREYHANRFVPMYTLEGLSPVRSVLSSTADVRLRFSRNETVIRGNFIKTYVDTRYPVVTIALQGGTSALKMASGAVSAFKPYFRPEVTIDWTLRLPPAGVSRMHLNFGTIVGQVPYPVLHLHEGNGTYLLEKSSFSTMDFFEFASDTWATLLLDHNFYGFFLGKIPFVKKLQIREVVTLKATWGMLGNRNDGRIQFDKDGIGTVVNPDAAAMIYFPEGMKTLDKVPYVEAGFALTNILRLFRVDFIWRCTHRDDPRPNPRNFVVNFGIELKF